MSLIGTEVGVFLSSTGYSEAWERWFNAREKYRKSKDVGLQLLVAQLVPDYLATVHPELPHDDLSSFKSYCATATAEEVSTLYSVLSEAESFWLNQKASSAIREYCRELLQLTDQIIQERAQKTPKAQIFRFVAGGIRFYDRLKSVPANDEERREALKTIMRTNTSLVQAGTNNGFTQELLWLIAQLDKVLDLSQIQRQPAVFFFNNYLQFTPPDFSRLLKIEATFDRKKVTVKSTQKGDLLEIDLGQIDFARDDAVSIDLTISLSASPSDHGFLRLQQQNYKVQLFAERKDVNLRLPYSFAGPAQWLDVSIIYAPTSIDLCEDEITVTLDTFKQLEQPLTIDIPLKVKGYDLARLVKAAEVSNDDFSIESCQAADSQRISLVCRMTIEKLDYFRNIAPWIARDDGLHKEMRIYVDIAFPGIEESLWLCINLHLHKPVTLRIEDDTAKFSFKQLQGVSGLLQIFAGEKLIFQKSTESIEFSLPSESFGYGVTLRVVFEGDEIYHKHHAFFHLQLKRRDEKIADIHHTAFWQMFLSAFLGLVGVGMKYTDNWNGGWELANNLWFPICGLGVTGFFVAVHHASTKRPEITKWQRILRIVNLTLWVTVNLCVFLWEPIGNAMFMIFVIHVCAFVMACAFGLGAFLDREN